MRRLAVGVLAGAVLLAGCGGSDDPGAATTSAAATAPAPGSGGPVTDRPDLPAVRLTLTKVADLDQPLAMTWCPGRPEPYVAEKGGKVRTLEGTTVLDISGEVSDGNEQGLLGIACTDTALFTSYTDRDGVSFIDQYTFAADGRSVSSGPAHVLRTEQPAANHNGGNIVFGPDGLLWYGLGDGGGANDRFGNAQEPDERLGSIMRLDPGNEGGPQIVVKGVRNPWRWSFDRATGDLWIGDVGQGTTEEIDKLSAAQIVGANLGWPAFEGTERFRDDVPAPKGAIAPVFEYGHDEGQSVAGGYVYRGSAIAGLRGAYLFADTYAGRLRAIAVEGMTTADERDLGEVPGGQVASFAEDPDGELYVLSLSGGVYRLDPA